MNSMQQFLLCHLAAFVLGYLLDLAFGDPYSLPHPIRWIGNLISKLEIALLGARDEDSDSLSHRDQEVTGLTPKQKRRRGRLLVVFVLVIVEIFVVAILLCGYLVHPLLGLAIEGIMTYYMLATKSLKTESMKVYDRLKNGTLEEARYAVSMIVGRDTKELDQIQVAKAAVETVAENTSDGIIAPMLYMAIFGPILGYMYKSINTMDSMVGYKNKRFMDFGRAAAKLDDVVNYLPARISAWLMIVTCAFLGKDFSAKEAKRIFKRDRYKHASPNSAQTESVCAGALGIQLAGPATYFGQVHEKEYIGDATRPVEIEDIKRANRLLYGTSFLCLLVCCLFMGALVALC